MTNQKSVVFLADDDAETCSTLERTLKSSLDVRVVTFSEGKKCLKRIKNDACSLLICNRFTVGMDGIDLLVETKRRFPALPVIVTSAERDVEDAVKAMKMGAFDFLQKPFDRSTFLSTTREALSLSSDLQVATAAELTPTEQTVLSLLLQCKSVKEIARIRRRSVRTIEDQRLAIMQKFGADNPFDLVRHMGAFRFPHYLER